MPKAAVVGTILLVGIAACEGEKVARYKDPNDGWTISYPASMKLFVVDEGGGLASVTGLVVASDDVRLGQWASLRRFPRDAVAFALLQLGGGPIPDLSPPEARFPLERSAFVSRSARLSRRPSPLVHGMIANGEEWQVTVWFGPEASQAEREKVWRIVESIRFPAQRPGTMSGYFYVLREASHYPVGAVVRIDAEDVGDSRYVPPFFLVHAPGGMYTVSWQARFEPRCHMAFDRSRFQFYCRTHRGRWNRVGDVIESPESDLQYNDALDLGQVKIGRDGHVLVGNWTSGGRYPQEERRFWPRLRRAGRGR